VRVAARESARDLAVQLVPAERDPRRAQIAAYRWMDERDLLAVAPVIVRSEWLGRRRVRVACSACGEGINYEREVRRAGAVLCRACAGERYYDYDGAHTGQPAPGSTMDLVTRRP
jgi:formylmethanofuran dehydrogenase subunit E